MPLAIMCVIPGCGRHVREDPENSEVLVIPGWKGGGGVADIFYWKGLHNGRASDASERERARQVKAGGREAGVGQSAHEEEDTCMSYEDIGEKRGGVWLDRVHIAHEEEDTWT